jgi:cytochrome c oxidase accessory protein FixG
MKARDPSKLTSVDEHGDRLRIIPAEVRGFFRRQRTWTQMILLVIFLILPWTTINGRQTILLNVPDREFALFGAFFKAHDVPLLFFILGVLTLGLAFVTSIWGRVWCGWACPQTVFIDTVFRRIEQWTEGNYIQRRRLRDSAFSFEKFRKSGSKWFLFILFSSLFAHSFMAYFVSAKELINMIQNPPDNNLTYFVLVVIFTAVVLFDFAIFREQFCVIMCPYGRIQSLLFDQKTLVVMYDNKRGEPRRGVLSPELSLKLPATQKQGDCVSCNRCVQVCPTGIDIRNGLQMECIACTACIDACDEIMEKVKKPKGLIRYGTLDGSKISLLRPRSLLYLLMIILLVTGLIFTLATREPIHIAVLRGMGLPYSYVKDPAGQELIQNQFRLHIHNQSSALGRFKISLPVDFLDQGMELIAGENPLTLPPDKDHEWYFFIRIKPELFKNKSGAIKAKIYVEDTLSDIQFKTERDLFLLGPKSE